MGFMGRKVENSKENNNNLRRLFRIRRRHFIIFDSKYVLIQTIINIVLILIILATFIFTYESTIIDPIEDIKEIYLTTYLYMMMFLITIIALINFITKKNETYTLLLVFTLIWSIIIMICFVYIKISWDKIYIDEVFEQFYDELEEKDLNSNNTYISIGNMSAQDEKKYYISECNLLYENFKIKTIIILVAHFVINLIIVYQIIRMYKNIEKQERLKKDDNVLFDDEENIKV